MNAERQPLDIEEVNLDAMTTVELLRERAEVAAAIPMITAQLQDKARRPLAPEDDSAEWANYRDWRGRARLALAHRKADLVTIKNILSERQDTGTIGNQMAIEKRLSTSPEELSERDRLYLERGRLIRAALAEHSPEGLLLRSYRLIRHLLTEYVNTLPDALDADDRTVLILIGMHCRKRYGEGRIKAVVDAAPMEVTAC